MRLIGSKTNSNRAIKGDDDLIIRTGFDGGVGKYGRLLHWLYIGDADVSLNEQMIDEDMPGHMMVEPNKKTLKNLGKFVEKREH